MDNVAALLCLDPEDLRFSLVSTTHLMRGEQVRTDYTPEQAEDARDAMAKALYGRLFAWIVHSIDSLLGPRGRAYMDACVREGGVTEVGILDIFGFENFERNSFEQFCINVANEQLQYFFNRHIFALELAQYAEEGIESTGITYKDNGGLLDMVLGKPLGFFALLDEECRFPRASTQTLMDKFTKAKEKHDWAAYKTIEKKDVAKYQKPTKNVHGELGKRRHEVDETPALFSVDHYAGSVVYNADGFLEKNRDTLSATTVSALKSSKNALVRKLFNAAMSRVGSINAKNDALTRTEKAAEQGKLSVSAQFKNSLLDLMDKMLAATPHFIRWERG